MTEMLPEFSHGTKPFSKAKIPTSLSLPITCPKNPYASDDRPIVYPAVDASQVRATWQLSQVACRQSNYLAHYIATMPNLSAMTKTSAAIESSYLEFQ
jgi:hypothetical protein